MNQNFSANQLLKFCKKNEWQNHDMSKNSLITKIDNNLHEINQQKFNFEIKKCGQYYVVEKLEQKLILRKLNDNIKGLYKEEQADRRIIIKQVVTLLQENYPMWILRTDIKKFYESIDKVRILDKIKTDSILSFHSIYLIEELFSNITIEGNNGLPRGINISATLSEIYMRRFDKWISSQKNIYYYARFVDDIILFSCSKLKLFEVNQQINERLEEGLVKNDTKTGIYNGENIKATDPLEYLGYKFVARTKGRKKELQISIAEKKIKKIKTRIVQTFLSFIKDGNKPLFINRIKFLSGNYLVHKSERGSLLKAGNYYSYSLLNNDNDLDNIDDFYRKLLFSRNNSIGKKLRFRMEKSVRLELAKYSFKIGFKHKIFYNFSYKEIVEINSCWK